MTTDYLKLADEAAASVSLDYWNLIKRLEQAVRDLLEARDHWRESAKLRQECYFALQTERNEMWKERDEARAELAANNQLLDEMATATLGHQEQSDRIQTELGYWIEDRNLVSAQRDEARAELAEEHTLYLIRTEERDEARAALAEALEDVERLRTRLENDASGRGY